VSAVETQPERTDLAWQRTGLGLLAVGGLLAHRAIAHGAAALLAVAGGTALLGLGVLGWLGPARARATQRAVAAEAPVSAPRTMALVTGAVVLVCLAAAAAVLVLPPE
jgi:putative membrane protein